MKAKPEHLLRTLRSQGGSAPAPAPRCTANSLSWWPPMSKRAASSQRFCPATKTIQDGMRCRCGCSVACTGWCSTDGRRCCGAGIQAPAAAGTPSRPGPDPRRRGRPLRRAARGTGSAAADQRSGPVRRADRRIAPRRSGIWFSDKAFRDRIECRAESASRPLPVSPCRWTVGTDRLAGHHRRRVAWPTAAGGPAADHRAARVRHRAHRRHRRRRETTVLSYSGPTRATGWTGCGAPSRSPEMSECSWCGSRRPTQSPD